jgi:isopentenyldiphosphate isomerase
MIGCHPTVVSEDMVIDTVDDRDVPTGTIKRGEVLQSHANFRVVHIFLFNLHDDLLIQQLSTSRERHPGEWGSSVAGYLFAGESYAAAAQRRVLQELGIRQTGLRYYGKTSMSDAGCKKFISLFVGASEGPFRFDREIIAQLDFLPISAINTLRQRGERTFTPTFRHLLEFYQA